MNINWEFVQQVALVVMFIAYVRGLFKLRRYRKSEAAREALIKRLDESEPPKAAPHYRFEPTPDISPAEVAYFIQHHFVWDNASTPYYRDIVTAIEQATSAVKAYWVEKAVEQSKCKRQFKKI